MNSQVVVAVAFIVVGFALGVIMGALVRRSLSKREQKSVSDIAAPAASLVFWGCVAGGLIGAVGVLAPTTLEPIPERVVSYVPAVIVAALMIIVGQALGGFVAAAVGQALERATGKRQLAVERVIRSALLGLAALLALAQLGIDTTTINLLLAGLIASLALSFALLAGLGGQHVAGNIAAGRSMRSQVMPGASVSLPGVTGVVTDVGPATMLVTDVNGDTISVPYRLLLDGPVRISGPPSDDES